MRCLGLNDERRRCEREAAVGGYCRQHRPEVEGPEDRAGARDPARGLAGLAGRLRPRALSYLPPDDCRYPVPPWLRKLPTASIIAQLEHSDSMTRWLACYALRRRRDPTAIDPLWRVLLHDSSRLVRQQSAVALGKIATPAALGPLVEGLWHDPDAGVRQACAIALGNLGLAVAASDLTRVLEREADAFVRWDCILALGRLGDATYEPLLIGLRSSERAGFIREACDQALAEIRRRA